MSYAGIGTTACPEGQALYEGECITRDEWMRIGPAECRHDEVWDDEQAGCGCRPGYERDADGSWDCVPTEAAWESRLSLEALTLVRVAPIVLTTALVVYLAKEYGA